MNHKKIQLKGWRYVAFLSCLTGAIGLTLYPIVISPMYNPEPWKQLATEGRKSYPEKEFIQPGNMKVWTDPFDREGKPGSK